MSDIVEALQKYEKCIIYGAGNVARALIYVLKQDKTLPNPLCCIVSDTKDNPKDVLGIPVKSLEENEENRDALVLIAATDKHYMNILARLKTSGLSNVMRFTFESWNLSCLNEYYLRKKFTEYDMEYISVKDIDFSSFDTKEEDIRIYMVQSIWDKHLSEIPKKEYASFLTPLQVGKCFSKTRMAELTDDLGDNISEKNRMYSELTGLYWLWRNSGDEWVGECHYRRHFMLTEDEVRKLPSLGIDVVLPVPIVNIPCVKDIYFKDHCKDDWQNMMRVLKQYAEEYYSSAEKHFSGCWYYAYNMMITRKRIFDNYCAWLFPLLFAIEKMGTSHEDTYQNRYIGFLAERLTSLYFFHHRHEFRILHVYKKYYL